MGVVTALTLLTQQILRYQGVSKMGAFFAKFRRQPADSGDAPRGPSRVTDQDKAVFVRRYLINHDLSLDINYLWFTRFIEFGRCLLVWPCS